MRKAGYAHWSRIEVTGDATIRNAQIRYGGSGSVGEVLVDGGTLTLEDSVIGHSSTDGVRIQGSDAILQNNTYQNNSGAAASMDLDSNPDIDGVVVTNNGINGLQVDSGALAKNLIWDDPDIVYWLDNDVTVPDGLSLSVEAGQNVKFSNFAVDLFVDGTLTVNGTALAPVVFTERRDDTAGGDTNNDADASSPGRGNWSRIELRDTSTGNTINHADIRYGGSGSAGMVQAGGPLELTASVLRESSVDGLNAREGAIVSVTNNILINNSGAGIGVESGAVVTAINNTIDANFRGVEADGAGTMLNLTNNLISFNARSGVFSSNGGNVTTSFNDVYNPTAAAGDYEGLADQTGTNNNQSADPKYVSAANAAYQLRAGSPAVDSATSQSAPLTDFEGNSRFDDPNVPDSGGGFPAYFDRGAVERQKLSFSNVDLVASNVTGPTVGVQDLDATINWSVQNIGSAAAVGPWHDAIYLSTDPVWSPNDRFLVDAIRDHDLGAGQSYVGTAVVTLSGVLSGNHYFIVRTNARNEVFEALAVTNNAASSAAAIAFAIPELTLGVPLVDQFTASVESAYYQIKDVPAGLPLAPKQA